MFVYVCRPYLSVATEISNLISWFLMHHFDCHLHEDEKFVAYGPV